MVPSLPLQIPRRGDPMAEAAVPLKSDHEHVAIEMDSSNNGKNKASTTKKDHDSDEEEMKNMRKTPVAASPKSQRRADSPKVSAPKASSPKTQRLSIQTEADNMDQTSAL